MSRQSLNSLCCGHSNTYVLLYESAGERKFLHVENDDTDPVLDVFCTGETYEGNYLINSPESRSFLTGYAAINGSLSVNGNQSSLEGLNCLNIVFGDLSITHTALENASPLMGLTFVGGVLTVGYNPQLQDFHPNALSTVQESVKISTNSKLRNISRNSRHRTAA